MLNDLLTLINYLFLILIMKILEKEHKIFDRYISYRKERGLNSEKKIKDVKRILLYLRKITKKPINEINLNERMKLVGKIKSSSFGDWYKNEIIVTLKSFLKWKVPNWSSKLKLDDIRLIKNPANERKIGQEHKNTDLDINKAVFELTKYYIKLNLSSITLIGQVDKTSNKGTNKLTNGQVDRTNPHYVIGGLSTYLST